METVGPDAKYIADRCRLFRKMLGCTQESLAEAAGLTTRTIEKVESGRHSPNEQTLRSIARALKLDIAVFSKPTPEQEKRLEEELARSLRKVTLVPTTPVRTASDFYSRNRAWDGFMSDASAIIDDDALQLAADISDWITETYGIWDFCTHSQRLDCSTSIAGLCRKLESFGYLAHFGSFRQQYIQGKSLVVEVAFLSFLPKANNDGQRYAIINLGDDWEVPEQDRPKP